MYIFICAFFEPWWADQHRACCRNLKSYVRDACAWLVARQQARWCLGIFTLLISCNHVEQRSLVLHLLHRCQYISIALYLNGMWRTAQKDLLVEIFRFQNITCVWSPCLSENLVNLLPFTLSDVRTMLCFTVIWITLVALILWDKASRCEILRSSCFFKNWISLHRQCNQSFGGIYCWVSSILIFF